MDSYGLSSTVQELLETYQPIWTELESHQASSWGSFLHKAAAQLGVATAHQEGSVHPDSSLSVEDLASHAVVESTLQQLLARGERHAPEVGDVAGVAVMSSTSSPL
jgi:hypothetical protein